MYIVKTKIKLFDKYLFMLIALFKHLFYKNDYYTLEWNYYDDFLNNLSKVESDKIFNLKKDETFKKILKDRYWNQVIFRIGFPRTQQNNGNISLYISINHDNKIRKDFHWIFEKKNWKLVNHWILEFKNKWTTKDWFAIFERNEKELCFNGHWSSKN